MLLFYYLINISPVSSLQFHCYETQSYSELCDGTCFFMCMTASSLGSVETLAAKEPAHIESLLGMARNVCICLPSCSFELFQGSEAPCQSSTASVRTRPAHVGMTWHSSGALCIWGWVCRRVKSWRNFCHKFCLQQDFPGNI